MPKSLRAGQKAVITLRYLSFGGAGTPAAFEVTTTAFAFVSSTLSQFSRPVSHPRANVDTQYISVLTHAETEASLCQRAVNVFLMKLSDTLIISLCAQVPR